MHVEVRDMAGITVLVVLVTRKGELTIGVHGPIRPRSKLMNREGVLTAAMDEASRLAYVLECEVLNLA